MTAQVQRPRWHKWLKWTGIGCASWVGLSMILGLFAVLSDPAPKPKAKPAALTAPDTLSPLVEPLPAQAVPLEASAPAPVPVQEEVPAPASKKTKSVTVYTTRTGDHYHRSGCASLRKSKYATTLEEARVYHRPCHRCNPPR
jgi:hypothetical protein